MVIIMMVVVIMVRKKYKIIEVQRENLKRFNASYEDRKNSRICPLNPSPLTITYRETKI
jgi:hypothetical protein